MPHIALRPDLVGITSLLAYRPETAAPLCELTEVLLRGPSTLTEAERELIATYVSHRNGCRYCSSAHGAAVCHLPGGSAEMVAALADGPDGLPVSEKMRALLAIAARVADDGRSVHEADIARARAAGATDRELHDTVLIAALFALYNRYVDGLGAHTPEDAGYYDALGRRITSRGYRMPAEGYAPLAVPGAP